MNGIHDMGGMHGMGPIEYEKDEPVFHHRWEALSFGLNMAIRAARKWSIDTGRYEIERIPPADYLRMSYYEKWIVRLEKLLVKFKMVYGSRARQRQTGRAKMSPTITADRVPAMLRTGAPASRDCSDAPRFEIGQQVRARNINPTGHTRLPRYARGKLGTIDRQHGVYVFPDSSAHFLGEKPQHVYSVRFAARELWGQQASRARFRLYRYVG